MRLGINLRGDLAKLSDDELASQLETCLAYREWLAPQAGDWVNRWMYKIGLVMPFGRGPLHSPIFYRAIGRPFGRSLKGRSLGDLYVLDCEIKDIIDELKRRTRAARLNQFSA